LKLKYARIVACGLTLPLLAQRTLAQAPVAQPPVTQAPVAPAPEGLDAVNDDRLLEDLANRGLDSLLERAFVVDKVPPARQDALRTLSALHRLGDPDAHLSARERRELIAATVRGMTQALPGMNDPKLLWAQASMLLEHGVQADISTLEYWGDSPKTQARVRPVVETVIALLDKCAAEAQKRADAIANSITTPGDPKAKQWEELSTLATTAAYTRHIVDYYLALSQDKAAPQRNQIAAKAIEFLSQYDNADSQVQPKVRLITAKLKMTRGQYDEAQALFKTVADATDIQPAPDKSQQWTARYFSAVSDVLARKPDAAQQGLDAIIAWQKTNLPPDKNVQDSADTATRMLQYRIESLRAELAPDEPARKAANDKAVTILLDLLKRRPELQSIVFEQLIAKLPAYVDMKSQDILLLRGFVQRADEERSRPETETADPRVLEQGVAAVKEITRRKDQAGVDPQTVDTANLLLGFFLDRLGRHAAAAEAFLDYTHNFTANPRSAQLALDNAQAIIARLRADKTSSDDPATVHAYERFLPIAIAPPFNRHQFAYEYARRLQLNGKFKEAIDYFRQVPSDDPRLTSARFFEMAAEQQRLDEEKLAPPERAALVAAFQKQVDDVMQRCQTALQNAHGDAEQRQYRSMLARTRLLAADVARRDQNDPQRTLALLNHFEDAARGLSNEQELLGTALYTRVQAFMQLGQTDQATAALVTLLKTRAGGEGASIVYNLLQKLNEELDRARQSGDHARMQVLATNRAQLSGFLVQWARTNPDPKISQYTYRYSVFDAATKHLAADLLDDPAARKAALQAALELYRQLESPESAALYQATLAPKDQTNPPQSDPAVSLGIGLIAYDLGDYPEAQRRLGQLLTDRKLGPPTIAVADDSGQTHLVDNDSYWEATLKLLRSNVFLSAGNDAPAEQTRQRTQNYLKELYIRWGAGVGGKKWHAEFEKLRAQLIPDFKSEDFTVAPTTQPAA
jgi:hypothetical protein